MIIRYAKSNETENIKEIWNYCFDDSDSFVNYYFNDKYSRFNTVVVDEGEEIVSSLQLNQYKLILNDKLYNSSYVVGVSTLPQVRGRGYMRNIMKFTLRELYAKGQLVSILMPIDYRLYRQYGYEHCYDQLEYTIDIEDLKRFKISGRLHKINESHINDLIDISNFFLKDTNGNVYKTDEYYKNLFKEVKSENGYMYIHEDEGNQGYIIYFLNRDKMFVREIFYKNINSLKSMLKFIYNHNTQCREVVISSPVNDKIRFILDNPKTSQIKIKPFMMGRIINLEEYLESLDIGRNLNLEANVFIEDQLLSENNGVFNIKLNNNKLEVKKVDSDYDGYFTINTMTQLAFSYIDIEEALVINDTKENECNENVIKLFNTIFTKKKNYINEYI